MPSFRRELLFSLVIGALCVLLLLIDIAGIPGALSGIRSRALVTAVDNSQVRTHLIVKTNLQQLQVRLLSGPHKGHEMAVVNMLTGKMEIDEWYEPGTTILVEYSAPDGIPKNAVARGAHRLGLQLFLSGLFALLLVAVAGVTGLKAGLSFVFAALVLWRLFFPLLLRGYPPIPTGLPCTKVSTAKAPPKGSIPSPPSNLTATGSPSPAAYTTAPKRLGSCKRSVPQDVTRSQ